MDRILGISLEKLDSSLRVRGFTLMSKLVRLLEDYLFFVKENLKLCKTLHEAEFSYPKIPRKTKDILMKQFEDLGVVPSNELYWFIWGTVRFLSIWAFFWNISKIDDEVFESLLDFILNGIDPNSHILSNEIFEIDLKPMEYEEDTTKAKLLNAAEKLFGEKGFYKVQITDITKEAGVATGTFYIYFETKTDALKYIVERINRNLRLTLRYYISNFTNRLDAEIAGYFAFLQFFKLHKNVYRIVRESEFIIPDTAIWYYKKIHQGYQDPLRRAAEKGQIREIPSKNLAIFLMGIGHFLGEDLLLGSSKSKNFKNSLKKLSKYLFNGLKGAGKL